MLALLRRGTVQGSGHYSGFITEVCPIRTLVVAISLAFVAVSARTGAIRCNCYEIPPSLLQSSRKFRSVRGLIKRPVSIAGKETSRMYFAGTLRCPIMLSASLAIAFAIDEPFSNILTKEPKIPAFQVLRSLALRCALSIFYSTSIARRHTSSRRRQLSPLWPCASIATPCMAIDAIAGVLVAFDQVSWQD